MVSSVDGLAVPLRLVRQVPPQRRESCVGGGNRGLGAEQALDFTPDEREASRRTSRSLNYTRHLLHCTEVS